MASAECIEQEIESINSSGQSAPESAHLSINPRLLSVGYAPARSRYNPNFMPMRRAKPVQAYPRLLLQGRWLEKAGFPHGSPVVVWVDHGRLTIEVVPQEMAPALDSSAVQMSNSTLASESIRVQDSGGMIRGSRPKRNLTLEQLWALEEREEDGYRLLARRETNTPIVAKALGAEIVARREALGMTAKQVYVRADLPAPYYYGMEGGSRQPSISVFLSVCEALAVHPRDFWNRVLVRMDYPNATRCPEVVRAVPEKGGPTLPSRFQTESVVL